VQINETVLFERNCPNLSYLSF